MIKNASARLTGTASLFRKLEGIAIELRGPIMRKGMQAGGELVAQRQRELVPVGLQPRVGTKADKKHLMFTIGVKVKEYASNKFVGMVTVVGPEYPAGAHGHLVEHGHVITPTKKQRSGGRFGGRTRSHPFANPALADTESLVGTVIEMAVEAAITKAIIKESKS